MNEQGARLPERAWRAVADLETPPDEYLLAATVLLQHVHTLPNAVMLRVPHDKLADEAWKEIVDCTLQLCACGQRRLLAPLEPGVWTAQDDGEIVVLDAGHPLELTMWAGDRRSALMRLTVQGDVLVGERSPYHDLSVADYQRVQGVVDSFFIQSTSLPTVEHRIADFIPVIDVHGEAALGQPFGPENDVVVRFCAVVSVDVAARSLRVKINPAVHRLTDDDLDHICDVNVAE